MVVTTATAAVAAMANEAGDEAVRKGERGVIDDGVGAGGGCCFSDNSQAEEEAAHTSYKEFLFVDGWGMDVPPSWEEKDVVVAPSILR